MATYVLDRKVQSCIFFSICKQKIVELHQTNFGVQKQQYHSQSLPLREMTLFADSSTSSQVDCSANTSQMTESLWRVAHLLTGNGHFFRKHAQVIRVGQDVIEVRKCEFPDVWNGHIIFGSLYFQIQFRLA